MASRNPPEPPSSAAPVRRGGSRLLRGATRGSWGLPLVLAAMGLPSACHSAPRGPASGTVVEDAATCDARARGFREFVAALPTRAVASPTRVTLPASVLGAVPGSGPLVELSPAELAIDGEVVHEPTEAARVRRFTEWAAASPGGAVSIASAGSTEAHPVRRVLYVAAAADLDVQTLRAFMTKVPEPIELRLLVRVPAAAATQGSEAPESARKLAARVLVESDPHERAKIAASGYSDLADCPALLSAVARVSASQPEARWPTLQAALRDALPSCDCRRMDTASLRLLVSAEQRAGAATLGWLPLSFIRDERCGASMALRSMKKLVGQIEAFDAEFAGGFQKDAVAFDDVLVNDRLRVNFCDALPGETLAAKQRARAAVYYRPAGSGGCEGWSFAPLSPGAPMGTITRTSGGPEVAFHYWQAAEDLRIFGPVDRLVASRPTDARDWPCEMTLHLVGVDEGSIHLEKGRWFFDEATCRAAADEAPRLEACAPR